MKRAMQSISDADYEALANLRYTLRRFINFSSSAAQDEGLPTQQHQALLVIRGHRGKEGVTIGYLAERLLIAPHTAVELVNRLAAAGYVERKPDPSDRRRQLLTLTPKAGEVLVRLSAVHLREIREMAPHLIHLLENIKLSGSERD